MRAFFVLFAFLLFALAEQASFITPLEYAKMLYFNPHGIGCNNCHGVKGEGGFIASYESFDKKSGKSLKQMLKAPNIVGLDYEKFKKAILNPKSIMPSYSLTDNEIAALYVYINDLFKKAENDK